jgi:hypothetical protein
VDETVREYRLRVQKFVVREGIDEVRGREKRFPPRQNSVTCSNGFALLAWELIPRRLCGTGTPTIVFPGNDWVRLRCG